MNKKEELAEYIIRNLIFVSLFGLFCFYGISNFLLPKIQDYQEQKNALKHTQLLLTKITQENQDFRQKIQEATHTHKISLKLLQEGVKETQLQAIAKDFFKTATIKKKQNTSQEIFMQTSFEIKATSNGVKPFFDFIKKIKTAFPNIAFTLPFSIVKNDPFSNTLEVTLILKSTQLEQKKSNKE